MPHLTQQQQRNLRERINDDARHALSELIADKLRWEDQNQTVRGIDAATLTRHRDEIVSHVVTHLLKHYTIRDRRR